MNHFADRIQLLNDKAEQQGKYVLYWMQQSQRTVFNHALEFAISEANRLKKPLLVVFGLMSNYPEANLRHYWFMLEGLQEVDKQLEKWGIRFVLDFGNPPEIALKYAEQACTVVCDCGYLRHQRQWRKDVAERASCKVWQVESDVLVPVEKASSKHEIGARTLRPRIGRLLDQYAHDLPVTEVNYSSLHLFPPTSSIHNLAELTATFTIDKSVKPVPEFFKGGTSEAIRRFDLFLNKKISRYLENRNQPDQDDISHMSMYLHFGQISPLYLFLQIRNNPEAEAAASYIEELIVRRELSVNFVHFNPAYDSYDCIPGWAKRSLQKHSLDLRPDLYSLKQLENCRTKDAYWNACMKEMIVTGFMHNYMRMYWGKKILEWSPEPEEAYRRLVYLNNKYFLDGRDPNGYANIGWIFGLHDRAWGENPIFGNVRIMKASGLKRKFNPEKYVEKVERLASLALDFNQGKIKD